MDRQTWFLLALALLVVASLVVSAAGWTLFVRERRAGRARPEPDVAATGDGLDAEPSDGLDADEAAPAPIPVPPRDEASDA